MVQTVSATKAAPVTRAQRCVDRARFNDAYAQLILTNAFTEHPEYYQQYVDRYRRTLEFLTQLPLPRPAEILEIGGGQIALLAQELFGDCAIVGDVNQSYAQSVLQHGVDFIKCDLLHDRLDASVQFDAIVLCEVIEHLPVPLYTVLERLLPAMRPGGWFLLTTPNLYRLRNVVRLALGQDIFCPFFFPEKASSLGHVLEFSADHLRWQLQRAGLEDIHIELVQLSNRGSSRRADLLRKLASPVMRMRPLWRDGLVAWARKPMNENKELA